MVEAVAPEDDADNLEAIAAALEDKVDALEDRANSPKDETEVLGDGADSLESDVLEDEADKRTVGIVLSTSTWFRRDGW